MLLDYYCYVDTISLSSITLPLPSQPPSTNPTDGRPHDVDNNTQFLFVPWCIHHHEIRRQLPPPRPQYPPPPALLPRDGMPLSPSLSQKQLDIGWMQTQMHTPITWMRMTHLPITSHAGPEFLRDKHPHAMFLKA